MRDKKRWDTIYQLGVVTSMITSKLAEPSLLRSSAHYVDVKKCVKINIKL